MTAFSPGLLHTPVTPFTRDGRVDFNAYGKLIEFHLKNGAGALALPMHAGESVCLSDAEQRALLVFAVKQVQGRVPVVAHVSDSGTQIAAARARYAEGSGAAAVIATTPYYWTPPPAMVLEHLTQIGAAVRVPFLVLHAPQEMGGAKLSTELVLKLLERLPNFAGLVDMSLDWQFMINVVSNGQRTRPDFQLLSGTEYMISAGAIGARSTFSSLAGVAPLLVRKLHDLCCEERYEQARGLQEQAAALRQTVRAAGHGGLKGALRYMGRECGEPRPPLDPLRPQQHEVLVAQLAAIPALQDEPKGW